MKWQNVSDWGWSADVENWSLLVIPNKPGNGFETMVLGFGNVVCRGNFETVAEAKRGIVDMFIGLIDEWKAQAEKLKEATK